MTQTFDGHAPDAGALGDPEVEEAIVRWWTRLPDFIKPDYPFDVPPARMAGARYVFTEVGAPRFCPEAACRRAGECRGGDGPPCYRADRAALRHVLLMSWLLIYENCPEDVYETSVREKAPRYAAPGGPAAGARVSRAQAMRRRR
jgi:hypothetical protein